VMAFCRTTHNLLNNLIRNSDFRIRKGCVIAVKYDYSLYDCTNCRTKLRNMTASEIKRIVTLVG
jgi:hypothetical protein